MSKQKSSWGIEIGSSGVKAIKLVARESGIDIENYAVIPYKQVLSTPEVDGNESIRLALQELLSRNEFENSVVVASLSGATGVARFVTLPPVEPKRIPEIIKFEAAQQIPFSIDHAEWDYQVFRQADMPDVKAGVFAVAKDRLVEYMANIHAADIHMEALTLSPLAVFNAFSFDHKLAESRRCTAYVDIGTMSTDVIIVEDNIPWVRTFPIGGHHLTEALVRQLKISYARAEEEKLALATSRMGKQMLQAMRGVVLDLSQEIARSITYYQQLNRGSEVKRIVGVGATFRLPSLIKSLSQSLPVEIERLEQFDRLEISGRHGSRLVQHSLELATAYGLALQGLDAGRVQANLLPRQLLLERLWGAKRGWFAGAAACMVAGAAVVGGVWWGAQKDADEVANNPILAKEIALAKGYVDESNKIKDEDPRAMSETLIRTQIYRDLYPRVVGDVGAALAAFKSGMDGADTQNQVQIRKISLAYVPPAPRSGNAPSDVVGTFNFSAAKSPFARSDYKPPRITVVVQGATTLDNREAATLVRDTVAKWLGTEQDRLAQRLKIWREYKKQQTDADSDADAAAVAKREVEDAMKCPDRPYLIEFDLNQLFFSDGGHSTPSLGRDSSAGGAGDPVSLAKLLPQPPKKDVASHDFRLTWDFVLLAPEDARQVLQAKDNQATPNGRNVLEAH